MDLFKTLKLENGLTLELFDGSKKIAADRWYLCLAAKVKVPVEEVLNNTIQKATNLDIDQVIEMLGQEVTFEQKMERNFIDDRDKTGLLKEMADSFLTHIANYLAGPNFAHRFIMKEYMDRMKKKSWITSNSE